ncbi:hypothetical protein SAMN02745134_00810 [Clostridium acidisoli DSM 12555]|uniref:Uncharacterized protein n=1 Tax=Clostridium acidisoli DSM 12555 TaxID=1121291 RepID=A0A1W1X782_9CLOT|nr:hypothetical protein [Clostridium acidisoli]SMC19361.1 hypothetical protein SAMN02745134_00810 [Clostridium acidisoli DSM 12555]
MDIKAVINKLIERTKLSILKWNYLDSLPQLCNKVYNEFNISPMNKNSFFTKINDGYFILVNDEDNEELYLIVFPTIDSRDTEIINYIDNDLLYQDELLRLLNLVKKQYPNVDDVISNFMNDKF